MNLGAASPSIGSRLHGPDPLGVFFEPLHFGFPGISTKKIQGSLNVHMFHITQPLGINGL